jgi:alanine racemase
VTEVPDLSDTHALVDLGAIRANARSLSAFAGKPILAPIKANAYGHGAINVARALEADVLGFAVATTSEALELRAAGIVKDVLLLTPAPVSALPALVHNRVSFVVSSVDQLEALSLEASAQRATVRVHLKVNTGLNRLGSQPEDAARVLAALAIQPHLELFGMMTHLVDSEDASPAWATLQLELFTTFLETHRVEVPYRHAANTGGVLNRSLNAHFDLIRPGIGLYGYAPGADMAGILELTPAMTLNAPVIFVKPLPAGQPVSYNATWVAPHDTRVATVRLGYADGYPRSLSSRASALLNGARVPQVGRVCMDQLLLDIGGLEVGIGDTVTIFGAGEITAQHVADWAGTNSYEILTGIASRVQRVYLEPS